MGNLYRTATLMQAAKARQTRIKPCSPATRRKFSLLQAIKKLVLFHHFADLKNSKKIFLNVIFGGFIRGDPYLRAAYVQDFDRKFHLKVSPNEYLSYKCVIHCYYYIFSD
jgi:hypothetical protein